MSEKLKKSGKPSKTYTCADCNEVFDQKSHYDRHLNRKIPCLLKDKPLKEVISEAVSMEVSKIIKETDKEIIISKDIINSVDNDEEIKPKKKSNKSKDKKIKEIKEIDYSYLRMPENEVIFEIEENIKENEKIKPILKMIDKAHNILYQSENIVGSKALQIIMNLLFIKLIQSFLSDKEEEGKIDLLNKKYYEDKYDDEELERIFGYFIDLKTLTKQPLKEIRNDTQVDAIKQMGEILKRHPITKMIYTEANFIKIREATTVQAVINEVIDKINFKDFEKNEDVIGEIYEYMLNNYVKNDSKELGQFFTPRKLMKLILGYVFNRLKKKFSKIDIQKYISIYDSCMGTGGWLVTSHNLLYEDYKNINLSGGEVEPETFQYGLMNICMTIKKFPNDIQCNSSLTHINNNKHHLIVTNPPFNSKKQIKFEQIKNNFEKDTYTKSNNINIDDIYKLKKDDPPIQFLELDTYKLEENGICIIVLPYGEFFFGNSYSKTRDYFMNRVNITDIILVPGGIFTHTDIKTCVLIYENGKPTKKIKFSKINKDCNKIIKITTVYKEDIMKEPNNSWYVTDYLMDEYIENLSIQMNNFEWIEFGKLFTLEKGKTQSSEVDECENGESFFINLSKNNNFKRINDYNLDGENVFISNTAPLGLIQYFQGKCCYSNLLHLIKVNKECVEIINIKYIYYFLSNLSEHIKTIYDKGSCNKSLDVKNLNRMKIPIPPIEIQNKLVNMIDSSNDKIKYMKLIIESFKVDVQTFFELTVEIENRFTETEWIEFGEVFILEKGKTQSSEVIEDENGEAFFINLSKNNNFKKINEYSLDGENIFISNTAPLGLIQYHKGKCCYSNLLHHIKINKEYSEKINIKYIYYFLSTLTEHIKEEYDKGSCNKSLDIKNLNRMKIQIPPIDHQNECINKINEMENIIKRWEKDVEDILSNGNNKFLQYLEKESLKISK